MTEGEAMGQSSKILQVAFLVSFGSYHSNSYYVGNIGNNILLKTPFVNLMFSLHTELSSSLLIIFCLYVSILMGLDHPLDVITNPKY
jgi:hypothetical protein